MSFAINIDTSAVVTFTNTLEKMHRSALPNAVRGALNKTAFDMKQTTMPRSAARHFEQRQSNFFRATSRVDMAKGWDIDRMVSAVGFMEQGLKGENNHAVKDLEQQERGGTIKARSFIPTDVARGGSNANLVRPSNRLSNINRVVNSNKRSGNKKQAFLKAAFQAGAGGYVIGNAEKKILWKIGSIRRVRGQLKIRMKPVYSFEENRSVTVSGTGFMREASLQSAAKMNKFYIEEARRQISRLRMK